MEFYKKRDFGDLIGDTLNFFKIYGKNFFKNYIALNGAVVILLVIVLVVGYGGFIKQLFGSNLQGEAYLFERYFAQNSTMLIITSVIAFVLIVLLSLIAYSFPVLYLKRLSESQNPKITTSEMIADIKGNLLNFFKFFLGALFIIGPLFLIGLMISSFLTVFLIGFLLLIASVPLAINIVNFTLFHLFHTTDGFWRSFSVAFQTQFSKGFWKYLGSTVIVYFLIQIVVGALFMIPFVLLYIYLLTGGVDEGSSTGFGWFMFGLAATYILTIFSSVVLSNLIYINAGLMYYDSRTDLQRKVVFSEIDSIGSNEE